MTGRIRIVDGVIVAVGKHVIAEQALAGGNKCVGVDEPPDLGVVITALEVIQPRLIIVDIATVSKRT